MVASLTTTTADNGTLSQDPRGSRISPNKLDASEGPRLSHLLSVARASFVAKGFAATTMDNIAGAAGMSKKTLYKMFPSKGDLFRAMLSRNMAQRRRRSDPQPCGTPLDQLRLSLTTISDLVLAPDEIALHRLIISERSQSPDIVRVFADVAFSLGAATVVDCVKQVTLKTELRGLPMRMVADMILGVVFASEHFRLMVDDRHRRNRKMLNKRIDIAIAMFCEAES